ncbi:MAG: BON domain-containing protein [Hyphomicrobiales bacterium]|nr:BON domain-containing protein [Hyphomicrobiales bacterium]MCP5000725.1 BON domain-containing protein [Hyphomicrobiales bacterium]
MTDPRLADVLAEVEAALYAEDRLASVCERIALDIDHDAVVTMESEVNSVAEKRIALERAAAVSGVSGIVDRLRVCPAQFMEDEAIRRHVCRMLDEDDAFLNLSLKEYLNGVVNVFRRSAGPAAGEIVVETEAGVVTLNGAVPSLEHKRLAGVLAWWVPGSRDVINGIAVEPPEDDGPDKIEAAVRIALDRDPFVDAAGIRVGVRHRVVRLTGVVDYVEQRHMAESDAWYIFGVDDVIDQIEILKDQT